MDVLAEILATAVVLAGCYAPSVRDCTVRCASRDDCASGQICGADGLCAAPEIAGRCRTAPPDAIDRPDAVDSHPDQTFEMWTSPTCAGQSSRCVFTPVAATTIAATFGKHGMHGDLP